MNPLARFQSRTDVVGHSSVQPWSAGEIFPATITRVERYTEPGFVPASNGYEKAAYLREYYAQPLEQRLDFTSFKLTLDGRSEEFATYDDAHQVARALISDSKLRAEWRTPTEWQCTGAPRNKYPVKSAAAISDGIYHDVLGVT